jgi:uncharacterized membrane protein AbrB (regulator of aidB expression)
MFALVGRGLPSVVTGFALRVAKLPSAFLTSSLVIGAFLRHGVTQAGQALGLAKWAALAGRAVLGRLVSSGEWSIGR